MFEGFYSFIFYRIIAHQTSAQRSKQKKAQYVAKLEMQAKSLQVIVIPPLNDYFSLIIFL